MLLQELLGIDEDIYLIEESYTSQRNPELTLQYLNRFLNFPDIENIRIIRVRQAGHTTGLLFFNPADEDVPVDFWSVFTGAFAQPALKEKFETLADSLLNLTSPEKDIELLHETWFNAVNEMRGGISSFVTPKRLRVFAEVLHSVPRWRVVVYCFQWNIPT